MTIVVNFTTIYTIAHCWNSILSKMSNVNPSLISPKTLWNCETVSIAQSWVIDKFARTREILASRFIFLCWNYKYTLFYKQHFYKQRYRLKFANFKNLSRKILRTELWNLCQMIAFFPNSILNTFLSGRVRPILGNFEFRQAKFQPGPKKALLIKKACMTKEK